MTELSKKPQDPNQKPSKGTNKLFDPAELKKYPEKPGIYQMLGKTGKILYVGKAKNLRARLKQYFSKGGDDRPQIPFLIAQVVSIETIVVKSDQDALVLENNLIKQHKPKYNVLLKDDKTYLSLRLATDKEWPDLKLVRHRQAPKDNAQYFGPYTSAFAARETVDLLRKLFPLRTCSDRELQSRKRPCILYEMGKCVAPCVQMCTKEEYDELVKKVGRFLKGETAPVLKSLKEKMEQASKELQFEKAGEILWQIQAVEKTARRQIVQKMKDEDLDVFGFYRQASDVTLTKLVIRGGKLLSAVPYSFANTLQEDKEVLSSFLVQHYLPYQKLPAIALLPFSTGNEEELQALLKGKMSVPQRGERMKLIQTANENAKTTFIRERDEESVMFETLSALQEKLSLAHFPKRIECYDNSNIAGSEAVTVKVAFYDGKPFKKEYRKYIVKEASGRDDYAMMYEAIKRRLVRAEKEKEELPDLILVDGGVGQLNIASRVLKELNVSTVDLAALTKEKGRHDKGLTAEVVFRPNRKDPINLKKNSRLLFLLQQIRDEAHRFAIEFHRSRKRKSLTKSSLDGVPGIGEKKRNLLLKSFGSVKKIKEASIDQIAEVKGISKKDAEEIKRFLQS